MTRRRDGTSPRKKRHTQSDERGHTVAHTPETDNKHGSAPRCDRLCGAAPIVRAPVAGVDCPSARRRARVYHASRRCKTDHGFYIPGSKHARAYSRRPVQQYVTAVCTRGIADPGRWRQAQVSRGLAWRPHTQGRSFTKDQWRRASPPARHCSQTSRDRAMDRLDHRAGSRSLARSKSFLPRRHCQADSMGVKKSSAGPLRLAENIPLVANRSRPEALTTTTPGHSAGSASKSGPSATRMHSVRKRLHEGYFCIMFTTPSYWGPQPRAGLWECPLEHGRSARDWAGKSFAVQKGIV